MTDIFTKAKRSKIMAKIRARDTLPERETRSILHRMGYRFRLNVNELPGKPDIVLPRFRTVVLVHGCFWHRHKGCQFAYVPKSRKTFWIRKFDANVARDARVKGSLHRLGWKVITVWECQLRYPETLAIRLKSALENQERKVSANA